MSERTELSELRGSRSAQLPRLSDLIGVEERSRVGVVGGTGPVAKGC